MSQFGMPFTKIGYNVTDVLLKNVIKIKTIMTLETSTGYAAQRLINPIVSAAAPLLDMALELVRIESAKEAEKYRQFLIDSIKAFESQLRENGYRDLTVLISRHLICAFIDEMLLLQSWTKTYAWQDKSLSWHFAHKKLANEDFFMVLEQALKRSSLNLDILELGYVCLSLGFQGKYRYSQDGQKKLTIFADKIYDVIRKQRREYSRQLFISTVVPKKRRWLLKLPSKRILFISMVILLLGIVGLYRYKLLPLNRSIVQSINNFQATLKDVGHSSE